MRLLNLLLLGSLVAAPAPGSDHIDGPVTASHRVADLTDLYAFPTPSAPASLTVILNAYPLVARTGHFTDKVNYTIFVRRASIREAGGFSSFETGDEVTLTCTFRTPEVTADHVVTCKSSNGLSAESRYDVTRGGDPKNDFRLYAGMRADPFFFHAAFATDAIAGKLDPPNGSDTMKGANILTIVLEVEMSRLYGGNPPSIVAVAAETTTRDSPLAPLRRLDRVGRPEVTNVSLSRRNEPDLRDQYNRDRPFEVPAANQRLYKEKIARNLAFYDALDGRRDWNGPDRDRLATLMADDFLVVDLGKPCRTQTFFEIEKAMLGHRTHQTCGGRKPADDVVDALFTLYVGGLTGKPVRDGVDHPSAAVTEKFPYLAAPDLGFWSGVKVFLGKKVLGIHDPR